jgi:ATP-dependent RNA helicase RhlE
MFDMGFAPQIQKILAMVPKQRQTLLFSATMPPAILKIAAANMQLPLRFEIAPQGTMAEKVEHELFFVHREQRMALLQKILVEQKGSALLFLRTKHNAKKVCRNLLAAHILAAELHSNRSLNQRRAALDGFKQGKFRVLVATDIASRGIDVKGIAMVINYDLPESANDYVHRIGRTGRAGLAGKAISFAMPDQRGKIKEIERLIRYVIPVSQATGLPVITQSAQKPYVHSNYHPKAPYKKNFTGRFHKKY